RGTGLRRDARAGGGDLPAPAGDGRALWRDLGCPACHGGTGPSLTHACALRAGSSPQAIERSILFGVGEGMPAYSDAVPGPRALAALVDLVRSLPATSPRTPDPR